MDLAEIDLRHADRETLDAVCRSALWMSLEDGEPLERRLASSPDDLTSRVVLLSLYCIVRDVPPESVAACRRHALWLLENVSPESAVATSARPHPSDTEGFELCKRFWSQKLDQFPDSAQILKNAATFFHRDRMLVGTLLERARELEPDDPEVLQALARHYERGGQADEALRMWEEAASSSSSPARQLDNSQLAARAFYKAGDHARARLFAEQALALAPALMKDRNYGYAVHYGHLVLGHVSFSEGDVARAKLELIEAGKTPGAPALNSFGPDLELAQKLFDLGEREAVVDYLELCSRFWRSRRSSIPGLCERIRQGERLDQGLGSYLPRRDHPEGDHRRGPGGLG